MIGHGHPKRKDLPDFYRDNGIEYVPDFDDVLRRADVYACDNSIHAVRVRIDGAAGGGAQRPVVPARGEHGLRFWDAAQHRRQRPDAWRPGDAVYEACIARTAASQSTARKRWIIVYAYRTGAAQRAADAIAAWAGVEVAA